MELVVVQPLLQDFCGPICNHDALMVQMAPRLFPERRYPECSYPESRISEFRELNLLDFPFSGTKPAGFSFLGTKSAGFAFIRN